jgi:hypothetical protein
VVARPGGQARFDNLTPMYITEADGVIAVYDVCSSESFVRYAPPPPAARATGLTFFLTFFLTSAGEGQVLGGPGADDQARRAAADHPRGQQDRPAALLF